MTTLITLREKLWWKPAQNDLECINPFCMPLNLSVLDRVNEELANRREENLNLTEAIRDQLLRFTAEMIDLRDALNEAVNNTARAAELNSVNEKTLEENNVRNPLRQK